MENKLSKTDLKYSKYLGTKIHRLLIQEIYFIIYDNGRKVKCLKCLCDCGNTTYSVLSKIISGDTKSCGCHSRDIKRKEFFARRGSKKNKDMTILDWK